LGNQERFVFRNRMRRLAKFCQVQIITYNLMNNHVHLQVRCPDKVVLSDKQLLATLKRYYGEKSDPVQQFQKALAQPNAAALAAWRQRYLARMGDISVFMKELKEGFSKWYNRVHERFGTLWAERFRSLIVQNQPSFLRAVAAYIDLNGVRAGLVSDPKDFLFCGYAEAVARDGDARRELAKILPPGSWKDQHAEYRMLLYGTAGEAKQAGKKTLSPEAIRKVMRAGGHLTQAEVLRLKLRYFSEGLVLGSKEYVDRLFRTHRQRYCKKRREGARPIQGLDWLQAYCMRRFKEPMR